MVNNTNHDRKLQQHEYQLEQIEKKPKEHDTHLNHIRVTLTDIDS